ncbi:MAG: hypothetical protein KDD34_09280, partial [Bdellovibrionales bacterium]|nr:hypothetical protein [Bdellovibrionales bacterium]
LYRLSYRTIFIKKKVQKLLLTQIGCQSIPLTLCKDQQIQEGHKVEAKEEGEPSKRGNSEIHG